MGEGNFKGGTLRRTLASIQYTVHKTTHNAALATLVLQIVMRRNVLFDRRVT